MNYDEPLANPLPKLYKEKRDDSEKVRFAIPKAKEPKKEEKEKNKNFCQNCSYLRNNV